MPVTESRRLALFDHARTAFGEEAASTVMDLLPLDSDQLATKADISATRSDLRAEISASRLELRAEIADLRAELHAALAEQTRTLLLSMVGIMLTGIALAFSAARFG